MAPQPQVAMLDVPSDPTEREAFFRDLHAKQEAELAARLEEERAQQAKWEEEQAAEKVLRDKTIAQMLEWGQKAVDLQTRQVEALESIAVSLKAKTGGA